MRNLVGLVTGFLLVLPSATAAQEQPPRLTVTTLISGLSIPWDLGFTPDGTMLFTERAGVIKVRLAGGGGPASDGRFERCSFVWGGGIDGARH